MEKKVTFQVSLQEANLIFQALGKLPFENVYELIGKLNDQANEQLRPSKEENVMPLYMSSKQQ
jgi:hypothetical protein